MHALQICLRLCYLSNANPSAKIEGLPFLFVLLHLITLVNLLKLHDKGTETFSIILNFVYINNQVQTYAYEEN